MKSYWLAFCFLTSAAAILWPGSNLWKNNQSSFSKVCLYSNDPSKFTPMCILCPNTLYSVVLITCVKGNAIPLNVSYTQANCVVGNCAVNMNPQLPFPTKGKREATEVPVEMNKGQTLTSSLFGSNLPFIPSLFDEDQARSVPYTMMVDGHNITITSIDEYFVHSDDQKEDYDLEEELD